MSPSDGPHFAEFLDDFFAECDEHLATIRRALLTLDGPDGEPQLGQAEALLRSFHTLKGLAGMAGLASVEQIAHQIEDHLRTAGQGQGALSPADRRALSGATRQIERVLAAHRAGWPLPDPEPLDVALAPPPDAAPGPPAEQALLPPPPGLVRADLGQIDALVRSIGDLVVSRARLREQLLPLEAAAPLPAWRALQATLQTIDKELRSLRQGVMQLRLSPVGEVFARVQFAAHDLAGDLGRPLAVELAGERTTIDKFVADRMLEPLLHLVRNAVSHGIEPAAERAAAGKPPRGTVRLAAAAEGDTVLISVTDDGRGIDADLVARRARELGLAAGEAGLDPAAVLDIICSPGFSTRDEADRASGRGVGMEIVRRVVGELGGDLSLRFAPGQGSCFSLRLPLNLAIVDGLLVEVAGRRFAVPLPAIQEIVELEPGAAGPGEWLEHRSRRVPLVDVAGRLGLPPVAGHRYALLVGAGEAAAGLLVGRLAGRRELVLRPLADPLLQIAGLAGAAELGEGGLALILDPVALARPPRPQPQSPAAGPEPAAPAGDERYLLFELAGSTYGLPERQIRHVDMVAQITPLPLAPPALAGVVQSRGELLPALDTRALLGHPPAPLGPRSRLLVAEAGGRAVGLIVDSARQIARVAAEAVRPAGPGAPGPASAEASGRAVGLLDLDMLRERLGAAPAPDNATRS